LLHGITPQTIVKSINDILDGVYKESAKNEFEIKLPENMSEKDLTKLIKQVEKRMKEHALNLEYEAAAKCRDELKLLRDLMFKS
jgi:excinuclease ABC subunit B